MLRTVGRSFALKYPKGTWFGGQCRVLGSDPFTRRVSDTATAQTVSKNIENVRPFNQIPGPKGLPFIGNTLSFILDSKRFTNMHEVLREDMQKYGPIFRHDFGPYRAVVVASPELVQEVFRKEEKYPTREPNFAVFENYRVERGYEKGLLSVGEEWFRARRVFNKKMLRPKEVEAYAPRLNLVLSDLLVRIEELKNERGEVDNVRSELFKWALENIGVVFFEKRLGALGAKQEESSQKFIDDVREVFSMFSSMEIIGYPAFLLKIYKSKKVKEFEALMDDIHVFNAKKIAEKLQEIEEEFNGQEIEVSQNERVDFLTYLLASKEMSIKKISANMVEMLAAAIDTTSNATNWLLYCLAENESVQENLHQEITKTLKDGECPTPSDIQAMPYLRSCIKEGLRLYPSAPENMRIPSADMVVGGFCIPAGTLIRMPLYAMGRDENIFPDPLKFRPERWLRCSPGQKHHPFAMLPFGFGTRACLGRRIAELEMELFLSRCFQKYKVEHIGEKPLPIVRGLLTSDKPINFRFIER